MTAEEETKLARRVLLTLLLSGDDIRLVDAIGCGGFVKENNLVWSKVGGGGSRRCQRFDMAQPGVIASLNRLLALGIVEKREYGRSPRNEWRRV